MKTPLLSIVIPVYNEAENIKLTLESIKKNIKTKHEIIVVFDSKKDTTVPVLNELQKKTKNLFPTLNTIMKGPSGAIRSGVFAARAPLVLVSMADLCDDLTQVDQIGRAHV